MKQTISKNKQVFCVTTVPYPKELIKQMKQAGYTIKEEKEQSK